MSRRKSPALEDEPAAQPDQSDQLRRVAIAMLAGTFYSSATMNADAARMAFLPVMLGGPSVAKDLLKRRLTVVYGIYGHHRACPMAINGIPVFMECGALTADDYNRAVDIAQAMRTAEPPAAAPAAKPKPRKARR